jgi:hypothetical protein
MDKTFAAIEKLKEVELELHRLKNYAEMMNRSVEAQREWQGLTAGDLAEIPPSCYEGAIWADARLKEKNK